MPRRRRYPALPRPFVGSNHRGSTRRHQAVAVRSDAQGRLQEWRDAAVADWFICLRAVDEAVRSLELAQGSLSRLELGVRLYAACAGIYPGRTPVFLDVGADNTFLRFGDFANHNAGSLLNRYRDHLCTFNDDIQWRAANGVTIVHPRSARIRLQARIFAGTIAVMSVSGVQSGVAYRLRVAHMVDECVTLGPGQRAVLWVWGCSRGCPGCLASPFNGPEGAPTPTDVESLAAALLRSEEIEGITFSGGEPFEQAAGLTELVRRLRAARPELSFCVYSGFTRAELAAGTADQQGLLGELDLLIDGPYRRELAADLLWRGSANQQVHFLTDRYRDWQDRIDGAGAGIEFRFDDRERISWIGVPPPGFVQALYSGLRRRGIRLHPNHHDEEDERPEVT